MNPSHKKSLNLLIIDDDAAEHELYREYLANDPECEYTFLDAHTGEEGERMYLDHDVDCVIVDYNLPDIDGLEVLKRLTRNKETVPAVMLTGEGNETIAVIAMQIGSQDYLPKRVVTPQALKRTIDRAVERVHFTRQMETYRRELERSNQDLERFANVVAHDLKSPLRAIVQHLQIVRHHTHESLDDKLDQSLNFAIDGAERMRRLIEALFEFSKAGFEKHPFTPVNCNLILDSVKSNLASELADKNAAVTSGELPTFIADGFQIMQLFQNLIGNALKFCKERPQIHVSAAQTAGMWAISVKDNGIGIPKEAQQKIFTIFKRLHSDADYEGCGIGLAICERVARNHGGAIHVESTVGKGSTFTFTLPAQQAMEQEKAA